MTLSKPQVTSARRSSLHAADAIRDSVPAGSGTVIPFPRPDARRTCRIPRSGEQRGEILLFLGVRYERLAS